MVRKAFPILQHQAMLFQANYQPYEMPRSSFVEAMQKVQNLGLTLSTHQERLLGISFQSPRGASETNLRNEEKTNFYSSIDRGKMKHMTDWKLLETLNYRSV